MGIKEIRPKAVTVTTPQCSEIVNPVHIGVWRKSRTNSKHWDPRQCQRPASVKVNGTPLCRLHAGALVLEMWLKGQLREP